MTQLENVVLLTVQAFVKSDTLFTALDVSNTVKNVLPFARHREIRDLVRGLFSSEIESAGYARTPINVVLANGSVADALLYHPLADSWDLDAKYDAQKRGQPALIPAVQAQPMAVVIPSVPVVPAPPPAPPPRKIDIWSGLFKSQPSLFPNK